MVHQQPRSRGAHEQITPVGVIFSPDSHGHERSFVGGLASDEKLTGSGHTGDGKERKKGLLGREGERRRKKRDRKEKKRKIF